MRVLMLDRARAATGVALATAVLTALSPAMAQEAAAPPPVAAVQAAPGGLSEGVVAIVNDNMVSSYDLLQRVRLLAVTSGVQPTEQNLPQLEAEALRGLIDERLQMQELKRMEKQQKATLVATDGEVNDEIADIARNNNTTPTALLNSLTAQGVGIDGFRDQLRASISWQNWIGGRYGSRIRISNDQVTKVERQLSANAEQPQYQISEVMIDAARVGGMSVAVNGAGQLVDQLQKGAPFAAVARQFSAAATAANGGDAGWVSSTEEPPEVAAALEQMQPGQLSSPIPVKDGVYIILLRDKRAGAASMVVSLKQAAVILPATASAEQVAAAQTKLADLRGKLKSCTDFEKTASSTSGVIANDLGEAEVKDLSPAFQEAANKLDIGQVSQPIRTNAGMHLIAVCGKRRSGADSETAAQIENRLRGQQLALISRRYLRDLRTAATIEEK